MTDLSQTIAPKSDQLNSDDLISGPRTIKITAVRAHTNADGQPIAIYFDGDGGKPYLPCKSMRRVAVQIWGRDGDAYVGREMTLYRDPKVRFGGMDVGGIRISHMTDIAAPVTMALTATRANRVPFTVLPLAYRVVTQDSPAHVATMAAARSAAKQGTAAFTAYFNSDDGKANRAVIRSMIDECKILAADADIALAGPNVDPFTAPADPMPDAAAMAREEAAALAAFARGEE